MTTLDLTHVQDDIRSAVRLWSCRLLFGLLLALTPSAGAGALLIEEVSVSFGVDVDAILIVRDVSFGIIPANHQQGSTIATTQGSLMASFNGGDYRVRAEVLEYIGPGAGVAANTPINIGPNDLATLRQAVDFTVTAADGSTNVVLISGFDPVSAITRPSASSIDATVTYTLSVRNQLVDHPNPHNMMHQDGVTFNQGVHMIVLTYTLEPIF